MITYYTKGDYTITHYQNELFKVFTDIVNLCDKYNLDWWLESGSLLGVIRHNDFIPWDDDIDIGMTRQDYEKFLTLAKVEFTGKYETLTMQDEKLLFGMSKVISQEYTVFEKLSGVCYKKWGVFVDILPFDDSYNNQLWKWILKHKRSNAYLLNIPRYLTFSVLCQYCFSTMLQVAIEFIDQLAKKIVTPQSLVILFTYYLIIHDKKDIFPLQSLIWRGIKVKVPFNTNLYLTKLFGSDYMKVPPLEKRTVHAEIILKNR